MKIQSWVLAGVLASVCAVAVAQEKPAAGPAISLQDAQAQKAEALTEAQIKQSHDMPALSRLAQLYNSRHDMQRFTWVLERVSELMPNSGDLKLQLAMAYAMQDDKTRAYDTLIRMQVQGFGYDIAKDPRFDPIHGNKVWDYIVANLGVNSKQFGEGKVAFDLPKGDHLYDALAWDAKRGELLVGSMRDGTIQLADEHGKLTGFIAADAANGLWGVNALAVDAAHGKLYVASTASPLFHGFDADNAGASAIFEFDLATGKLLHKYTFPQNSGKHVLTSIVAGKDGQVYAADSARKQVVKIDDGKLRMIIENPHLTSISALALSDDGRTLYLSDFALGIFGFDLGKSAAFEPAYDMAKLVLGGIVGMHWYDGTLIIVENGMVPKRVMRLTLSADGRSIKGAMPLDVAQPAFAALGPGAVAGDKLYFIANREDALYDDNGVLTEADKLAPTQIFRSSLRFAWGQSGAGSGPAPFDIGKGSASPSKPATATAPVSDGTKH